MGTVRWLDKYTVSKTISEIAVFQLFAAQNTPACSDERYIANRTKLLNWEIFDGEETARQTLERREGTSGEIAGFPACKKSRVALQ